MTKLRILCLDSVKKNTSLTINEFILEALARPLKAKRLPSLSSLFIKQGVVKSLVPAAHFWSFGFIHDFFVLHGFVVIVGLALLCYIYCFAAAG